MFRLCNMSCHLLACGSTSEQALKMREGIRLSARGSPGRFNHLSGDHLEMDEPGQSALPNRREFPPQRLSGLDGQIGMVALDGLHSRQLIQTAGAFPKQGSSWSTGRHLTSLDHLFVSAL